MYLYNFTRRSYIFIFAASCTLLAMIIGLLFFSQPVYADDNKAQWRGNDLYLHGNKFVRTDYGSINEEVYNDNARHRMKELKRDFPPPQYNTDADFETWTFFEWKENSDCQDVIAIPPNDNIKQVTHVAFWRVDGKKFGGNNYHGGPYSVFYSVSAGCWVTQSKYVPVEQVRLDANGRPIPPDETPNEEGKQACEAQWLGWIICQVSRVIALTVQGAFKVLKMLMVLPPLDRNQPGGRELFDIWGSFRNLANLFFIFIFLTIVISQVTNMGISNYGVKKMLPRMIVVAVLINVSFILCAILVDVFNVLGNSIFDILMSVQSRVDPEFGAFGNIAGSAFVLAGAGALGALIYINALALVPLLVSGIFALFVTIITLVVRQAVLIIFVALSPLAFALNILPSTQPWFNKYWSNFMTLLMLYPAIAAVFGGSQVLAGVVSAAAPATSSGITSDVTKLIFAVLAIAVQLIPFFFTPLIVKLSGQLVNKLSAAVNNPSKKLFDKGQERAGQWAEDKEKQRETAALNKNGGGLYTRVKKRSNARKQIADHHASQLSDPTKGAYGSFMSQSGNQAKVAKALGKNAALAPPPGGAGANQGSPGGGASQPGGTPPTQPTPPSSAQHRQDALENQLQGLSLNLEISEIEAATAIFTEDDYNRDELRNAAYDGVKKDGANLTEDEVAAARQLLAKSGTLDDIHKLIEQVRDEQGSASAREALIKGISNNPVAKGASHLNAEGIRAGQGVGELYDSAASRGAYTPGGLASQNSAAIAGLAQHSGHLSESSKANIRNSREIVHSKEKYRNHLSPKDVAHINSI